MHNKNEFINDNFKENVSNSNISLNNNKDFKNNLLINNNNDNKSIEKFSETKNVNNNFNKTNSCLDKKDISNVFFQNKELLKSNFKLSNVLNFEQKKLDNLKLKINDLNEKIENIKYENDILVFNNLSNNLDRNNYEITQKQVTDYCNNMKKKSNNIEKTIEEYNNIEKKCIEDIKTVKLEYDTQISFLNKENSLISQDNKILEDECIDLANQIRELEIKVELVQKETEVEKAMFNEKDLLNRIKYENLENKYIDIQKKIYSVQEESKKKTNKLSCNYVSKNYSMKKEINNYKNKVNSINKDINCLENQYNCKIKELNNKKEYLQKLNGKLITLKDKLVNEPGYLKSRSIKDY